MLAGLLVLSNRRNARHASNNAKRAGLPIGQKRTINSVPSACPVEFVKQRSVFNLGCLRGNVDI